MTKFLSGTISGSTYIFVEEMFKNYCNHSNVFFLFKTNYISPELKNILQLYKKRNTIITQFSVEHSPRQHTARAIKTFGALHFRV